jgi:predicted RNase H-like HicB family nuclease
MRIVSRRYAIAIVREEGEYWAFIPDVPGVYGRGGSAEEATSDAGDALKDFLAFLRERGERTPEPAEGSIEVRYAEVPA